MSQSRVTECGLNRFITYRLGNLIASNLEKQRLYRSRHVTTLGEVGCNL